MNSEDILKTHRILMGYEPTANQSLIYNAFPKHRGAFGPAQNEEVFQAVSIMALVQTYTKKTQAEPFQVFLLIPSSHERWAVDQLQILSKSIFERLREQKAVAAAKAIGKSFKAILMGSKVLTITEAPPRWASYGFPKDAYVPEWLREALL